MTENMTRADIAEALYRELGFSHAESFKLIEDVISEIINALKRDEVVKLSNFATFSPIKKKQRMGRNPKTKKEYPISARTTVSFKASPALKKKM